MTDDGSPPAPDAVLAGLRAQIDQLDAQLIELMRQRFEVTRMVGRHKRTAGLPAADPARERVQVERLRALAEAADLDPAFSEKLLRLVIDEVIQDYSRRADA